MYLGPTLNQLDTRKHVKYNEKLIHDVISRLTPIRPYRRPQGSRPRPRPEDINTDEKSAQRDANTVRGL